MPSSSSNNLTEKKLTNKQIKKLETLPGWYWISESTKINAKKISGSKTSKY